MTLNVWCPDLRRPGSWVRVWVLGGAFEYEMAAAPFYGARPQPVRDRGEPPARRAREIRLRFDTGS